tara:strand:- start:329 stop:1099 length:771 start_codon:yes stop_codon:yes gene_type:complete
MEDYRQEFLEKGWFLTKPMLDELFLGRLRNELDEQVEVRRKIQEKVGIDEITVGTGHHLLERDSAFLDLLDQMPFYEFFENFFEGPFILNSYGGVLNSEKDSAYVHRMHRDIRSYVPNRRFMINLLVMLDDFTMDNGATHLASGSHLKEDRLDEEDFFKTSDRAVGKAGSYLIFDSRVWHSTGMNLTGERRRALTLTFTPPYFKPQFDYVRYLGESFVSGLTPRLQQVIGFYSRTPADLNQWYQPKESRYYRSNQG